MRALLACLVLAGVAVVVPEQVAESASLPKVSKGKATAVAPGVTVQSLTFTNSAGKQRGYAVNANLATPGVRLIPTTSTTSSGRVGKTQAVTTTVNQRKAIAGMNADQFEPATGIPLGGVMVDGAIYKSPFTDRKVSTVYVLNDGSVHVGALTFRGSATLVTPSASPPYVSPTPTPSPTDTATPSPSPTPTDSSTPTPPAPLTFPLTSVNTPKDAMAGNLTLFTSALPAVQLPGCVTASGTWAVDTKTLTITGLWADSTLVGQLGGASRTLAGCGAAGTWLSANLKLGSQLAIDFSLTAPGGQPVQHMISSTGLLVANGAAYADKSAIVTSGLNPESALCISADGKQIKMVAVDGRRGKAAPGVTIAQLRDLLLALNCYTGVVLDGGGSTSLVVKHPGKAAHLVNTPSGAGKERRVPNVLLLFYKK